MIVEQEFGADQYEQEVEAPPSGAVETGPEGSAWDGSAPERDLDRELQAAIGLGNDPGLEFLVDLAKRGECDPWDLDVVDLTDTYLAALDEVLDARDLGKVARLIFYAACLIHLKAQAMANRQRQLDYEDALDLTLAEEFEFGLDDERGRFTPRLLPGDEPLEYGFLRGGDEPGGNPASFLSPRDQPLRARGLTLVDLIFALREYDDRLAQRELLEDLEPDFDGEMAFVECVGSSHQDNLEGDIEVIREQLWARLGRNEPLAGIEQRVELTQLVTEERSRPAAFLAALFLAHEEEVHLAQEEFYGELWIERGPYFGEIRAGVVLDENGREAVDWAENELDEILQSGIRNQDADDEQHTQEQTADEGEASRTAIEEGGEA
ncbi:MAG: segregation/condensation protein A [Planctomycetes bacterium]|nr:segregation/condensation protein A [Planctomycetota bacterium]